MLITFPATTVLVPLDDSSLEASSEAAALVDATLLLAIRLSICGLFFRINFFLGGPSLGVSYVGKVGA